jgi:hypothetical protein
VSKAVYEECGMVHKGNPHSDGIEKCTLQKVKIRNNMALTLQSPHPNPPINKGKKMPQVMAIGK